MGERILVVTGGGDCPGLNPTIRSITLTATRRGDSVIGSIDAFNGILADPPRLIELTPNHVAEIHSLGGTILGTTNKGNPLAFPVKGSDGEYQFVDRTEELINRLQQEGVTAVINIGGDGSQRISEALFRAGVNIIGIPKTIDNDLAFTDFTFGFRTAVDIVTDAVDKLTTTAKSHRRIMILEVMGRDAGWIALNGAIAGGAHMVLIPEIPFNPQRIITELNDRSDAAFTIIVVAEGAFPIGKSAFGQIEKDTAGGRLRLGGIAHWLESQIAPKVSADVRVSVLGHLQRGGSPNALDRIIASEFGHKAVELIHEGSFGVMTSYHYPNVTAVPLEKAVRENKYVNPDSYLVRTAIGLGISFGVEPASIQ